MLGELTHMDRITQLQDGVEQVQPLYLPEQSSEPPADAHHHGFHHHLSDH